MEGKNVQLIFILKIETDLGEGLVTGCMVTDETRRLNNCHVLYEEVGKILAGTLLFMHLSVIVVCVATHALA
jgi:hypothetical protein